MSNLPHHIAIVMDGNGRWAKQHNLPRVAGHRAGLKAVRKVIKLCCEKQISNLTLFAFGAENWHRPRQEVNHLMDLFILVLRDEIHKLHEQNIHAQVIGDRSRFEPKLQNYIAKAEEMTSNNTGLKLLIAASYSGRWDIVEATKKIAADAIAGKITLEQIDIPWFSNCLATGQNPPPDLFIRTSGELRLSNFMLWQMAYTELYFTNVYWPDFSEIHFEQALESYASRQRRFGCIAEQLKKEELDA